MGDGGTTPFETLNHDLDYDVLIIGPGFDAVTGAFHNRDLRGAHRTPIMHRWRAGPQTFLGIFVRSFPNTCMVMGPHQAFGNIPHSLADHEPTNFPKPYNKVSTPKGPAETRSHRRRFVCQHIISSEPARTTAARRQGRFLKNLDQRQSGFQ